MLRCDLSRRLGLVESLYQHRHQLAGSPKPLRYIVNTSAAAEHVGGNEKIAAVGTGFSAAAGLGGAVAPSKGRRSSRTRTCSTG